MATYGVTNGLGDSVDEPSEEEMRSFLQRLDPSDVEHGAAWLWTEEGVTLEWSVDGRLVFDTEGPGPARHMKPVSRERVLELWMALARGGMDEVESCGWEPGNGYVLTAERERELRDERLAEDRSFYDSLGVERVGTRCNAPGCTRGTVAWSVRCRVHHFESIRRRSCPFDD